MQRGRRSVLCSYSDDELAERLRIAGSVSAALRSLGLAVSGCSARLLRARLSAASLASIDPRHAARKASQFRRTPLKVFLAAGRPCNSSYLKRRLLGEGLLIDKCAECGIEAMWNARPIS